MATRKGHPLEWIGRRVAHGTPPLRRKRARLAWSGVDATGRPVPKRRSSASADRAGPMNAVAMKRPADGGPSRGRSARRTGREVGPARHGLMLQDRTPMTDDFAKSGPALDAGAAVTGSRILRRYPEPLADKVRG